MKIDFTKPVQNRKGDPVRILCTDRKGEWPIVGLIGENQRVDTWREGGRATSSPEDSKLDLVNVPPPPAFDPSKPVRTRDGRQARILCTDLDNPTWTIAAAIKFEPGEETVHLYRTNGAWSESDDGRPLDLINM